jgi:hypothetical protein
MITSVRPYFKSVMVNLGFKEWRRALEPSQIPKTLLADIFHIKTDNISGVKQNQRVVDTTVAVQISFATKAGSDEVSGYERAESTIQEIIQGVLDPAIKNDAPGILNITFNSATPEALAPTNDNVLLSRVNFTCAVALDV